LLDPTSAFIVAALIPFAAIITQGTLKPKAVNWSWPLRMGSLGVAFAGAVYAYSQHPSLFIPSRGDWVFLGALLILLVVYLFWPQLFGARTAKDRAPQIQSLVQGNVAQERLALSLHSWPLASTSGSE